VLCQLNPLRFFSTNWETNLWKLQFVFCYPDQVLPIKCKFVLFNEQGKRFWSNWHIQGGAALLQAGKFLIKALFPSLQSEPSHQRQPLVLRLSLLSRGKSLSWWGYWGKQNSWRYFYLYLVVKFEEDFLKRLVAFFASPGHGRNTHPLWDMLWGDGYFALVLICKS